VLAVNAILGEKLTKRQKQQPVVRSIGDIFLEIVPKFAPFVEYGGHQLWGKYEYEQTRTAHPAFAKFADVSCGASIGPPDESARTVGLTRRKRNASPSLANSS
jgi:hypothetical protein